MQKKLILAEKPSVGNELAKVLHCQNKKNGYMEGPDAIVTWAFGHLVTLADPDAYNPTYAQWQLSDLPIIPQKMDLVVIKQTSKQFKIVSNLMRRPDVSSIIIATDAGREGELVARWIIEKANVRKPIQRLWVSSVTEKALKDGFRSLKPGTDYENLYAAAVARAESDWIVGINATRALTTRHNAPLSCGRVQTPTLAIIRQREELIQQFVPRTYYGLTAQTKNLLFSWQNESTKQSSSFDLDVVKSIQRQIAQKEGVVTNIQTNKKHVYSPYLYDLTTLQKDAFQFFGYSAKKTLSLMQSLYETHKVVTYPRTDSRYLTDDLVDTLGDRLSSINLDPYRSFAFKLQHQTLTMSKRIVDNNKVTDHHAIIPTEVSPLQGALSFDERNIYELIIKRFLSVLMPPFVYEEKKISMTLNNHLFTTKGIQVIDLGWQVLEKNKTKETHLPEMQVGDTLSISRLELTTGKTQPPSPFDEGTLLSAMANPVAYLPKGHRHLKDILHETGGLGTVATRADIIEKLFNQQLILSKGKHIATTHKGRQLLDLVPEALKSPLLTAEWESQLDQISRGKGTKRDFIEKMQDYTREIVQNIKTSDVEFKHDNLSTTKCPHCHQLMLTIENKHGKRLVCQDRSCGHKIQLSRKTNARCPNCHKQLDMVGQGDQQTFICPSCHYKEKLSSFEKRKGAQRKKGGKKDYHLYKKKLEKIENQAAAEDNPFAALARLKDKSDK